RESVRAGQVVLPGGDGTADRAHVLDASGGIEGRGAPFVSSQGRGLFLRRLRVVLDGDVGIAVGELGAERDQVVLGGQLGILQFLLPTPAHRPPEYVEAKQG